MPFALDPRILQEPMLDAMAAFLLVFFRMTGLVLSAPLLSSTSFPVRLRLWFAFWLAATLFPIARAVVGPGVFVSLFQSDVTALVAVASEFAIGWCIGWAASIVLWAAQMAGHIMGQEIGLSMGEVFDPVSQSVGSPTANLLFTLALVLFVVAGGPALFLHAAARSFQVAPVGTLFSIHPDVSLLLARDLGGEMWHTGLRIALPIMIALLLATVGMAILARAVPEMNIFILGFALRIAIGLAAVCLLVPHLVAFLVGALEHTDRHLLSLLETLAGR